MLGIVTLARAVAEYGTSGALVVGEILIGPATIYSALVLQEQSFYRNNDPRTAYPKAKYRDRTIIIVLAIAGVLFAMVDLFGAGVLMPRNV